MRAAPVLEPGQAVLIRRFPWLTDKVLAAAISAVGPARSPSTVKRWRRAHGIVKRPRSEFPA